MKPKTALQREIAALSAKLPKIGKEHEAWAYDKCLDKFAVRSRNTLYCLECGHQWHDKGVLISTLTGCTCPKCGSKLECTKPGYYNRGYSEAAYFAILTTSGDMQVIRMVYAHKRMKKREVAVYFAHEVMQHWVLPSGKVVTLSRSVMGLTRYYDQWIFYSDLEVRLKNYNSVRRYDISPYKIYPGGKVMKTAKRNGFKGRFYGIAPHRVLSLILTDTYAETLLKSGQTEIFKHYFEHNTAVQEHWPSIKICIRNGYKPADASIYFDYLDLASYFGKDLHSPKYVCPADLKAEHDRLMRKKRDKERREEAIRRRAELKKSQAKYVKEKKAFFGMVFKGGKLKVKPLESVEEFMLEGDALNHCVFTNEYYKRSGSLVLSARVNDEPVETIELSLKTLDILQARGKNNQPSKYHDQVLELVRKGKRQITKRLQTINN